MAALKAVLDSLDGVGDVEKEFYVEKDGKFVLQIEEPGKHPVFQIVKKTADALDRRAKAAEAKLAEAEAKLAEIPDDFSAEEYAKLKLGDKDDPEAKKKFDEQVQKQREILEQKHANALKAKDAEIEKFRAEIIERDGYIDKAVAENGLKDALLGVGVDPDLLDGALASLRPSVKVQRDEKSGDRKAVVETDLGEMDVPSFVKDWAAAKGKAYLGKPTGPDPKGNNGARTGQKTMPRAEFDNLDPDAQMKAITQDKVAIV